jgi:hypothetical protein
MRALGEIELWDDVGDIDIANEYVQPGLSFVVDTDALRGLSQIHKFKTGLAGRGGRGKRRGGGDKPVDNPAANGNKGPLPPAGGGNAGNGPHLLALLLVFSPFVSAFVPLNVVVLNMMCFPDPSSTCRP